MHNQNRSVRNLVLAALMLALAYILPNFTGNIPQIGAMLLPMHLPTILCGFLCGGPWGAAVGFLAPLMRSLLLTRPPLFPTAIAMAFELATSICPGLFRASTPPSSAPCCAAGWSGAL